MRIDSEELQSNGVAPSNLQRTGFRCLGFSLQLVWRLGTLGERRSEEMDLRIVQRSVPYVRKDRS